MRGTQAGLPQHPQTLDPETLASQCPSLSLFHCSSREGSLADSRRLTFRPSYTTVLPTSHTQISTLTGRPPAVQRFEKRSSSTACSQGRFAGSCQALQLVCPKGAVASICTLIYPALSQAISANSSQQYYEIELSS